eukprot:TRINITY_DN29654_c0_g1_i1.p1 TRINITY_DN29654_c0_g1~~TRINITY_DN29654_c0_g1_i1.p1  ORF type:complete len:204 (+),score=89.31 TRINITY_DN29654_c0_g1_i1:56-667(+)
MYDAEGNYVSPPEAEEEKKTTKKKKARKGLKRKAAESADADDDEYVAATTGPSPFADLDGEELTSQKKILGAVSDAPAVQSFDNDKLGDEAQSKQVKTEKDRQEEADLRKRQADYHSRMASLVADRAKEQKEERLKKKSLPSPMGHFSNEASDTQGLISDGIYQWTSMGLGKTPLKVKKQWKGTNENTGNSKRMRKNLQLPRD